MAKPNPLLRFLDLEDRFCDTERSSVVILPVPYERTTSYGSGTAAGPTAILAASQQVELYDEELGSEPFRQGILTLPSLEDQGQPTGIYLAQLESKVSEHLKRGRFVVCLGGEHSLTQAPVKAALALVEELGVVQFDAHADLRHSYHGTPFSHACVMRRVHEMGLPTLAVGIRSLSPAEAEFAEQNQSAILWGYEMKGLSLDRFRRLLRALPRKVYLTFDVDFLDPSLLPATGTPEPGGGDWWSTLALLRLLFEEKEVVAMDIVELAPMANHRASDFTAARLTYKCIAYRQAAGNRSPDSTR